MAAQNDKQYNPERCFFNVPEVSGTDLDAYPLVSEPAFRMMEQEYGFDPAYIRLFPFVRKKEDGTKFIDLYFWDILLYPESYKRFIICEGHRMFEGDEACFLHYVREEKSVIGHEQMDSLYIRVREAFPHWNYLQYSDEEVSIALEHLYFASHRSGAREILYKAGLQNLACHIADLPSYNMIGADPCQIVGRDVPGRLLEILNEPYLVAYLYDEESIERCKGIYREYGGLFDNKPPSAMQWRYLWELYDNKGVFAEHGFIGSLYSKLAGSRDEFTLREYGRFLELRDELPAFREVSLPDPNEVCLEVRSMLLHKRCNDDTDPTDALIKERRVRDQDRYEFGGEEYMVLMPGSALEIKQEKLCLENDLWFDALDHAKGKTTILFVRKRKQPDIPFVTVEVYERNITQVFGKQYALPSKEVYQFLDEYARYTHIEYDPYDLITEALNMEQNLEFDDELWELYKYARAIHPYDASEFEYDGEVSYVDGRADAYCMDRRLIVRLGNGLVLGEW